MYLDAFLDSVGLPLPDSSRLEVTGTCLFEGVGDAASPAGAAVTSAVPCVEVGRHTSSEGADSIRSRSPRPGTSGLGPITEQGHVPRSRSLPSSPPRASLRSTTLWRLLELPALRPFVLPGLLPPACPLLCVSRFLRSSRRFIWRQKCWDPACERPPTAVPCCGSIAAGQVGHVPGQSRCLRIRGVAAPVTGLPSHQLRGRQALLLDSTASSVRRILLHDLRMQVHLSALPNVALVYQEGELPPPEFQVPRPEEPIPPPVPDLANESPGLESEDPSYLPDLLCISVVIFHFQCTYSRHQIWYEQGEHIDTLMVRARILLNSDPEAFTLEAVQPQPPRDYLTLLGFPSWWMAAGIRPMLVHRCFSEDPDFVQPCFPRQLAGAFIPPTALPGLGPSVAYFPFDFARAALPLHPDEEVPMELPAASLVCVQPEDRPAQEFLPVQQHLLTLHHVPAAAHREGPGPDDEPWLALFLGFDFHYFFVELAPGSVLQHLSHAVQVPRSDLYIVRQWPVFDSLVVEGRRPRACFGYRNLRDLGRPFRGRGLFVDARAASKSVAFREFHIQSITPRVLCTVMDIWVPPGYTPQCAVGDHRGGPDDAFTIVHGSTAMLWLELDTPILLPTASALPASPLPDADTDGPSSGGSGRHTPDLPASPSSTTGTSRSRSPPAGRFRQHAYGPFTGIPADNKWSQWLLDKVTLSTCAVGLTPVVQPNPSASPSSGEADHDLRPCILPLRRTAAPAPPG